jgi:hypothetical protein
VRELNVYRQLLMRSFFIHWTPLLVWIVVIFVGSSLTADSVTERTRELSPAFISSYVRLALAHVAEFAILAVLAYWAFRTIERLSFRALWSIVLVFTTLYAISDEAHQAFTPGRVPSLEDVLFDAIGGVVGITLSEVLARRQRGKRTSSSP